MQKVKNLFYEFTILGEPGSTPYNNTYNSIPKKANPPEQKSKSSAPEVFQDAQLVTVFEIDVSAHSLSPTLSESSTFENSNSDSPRTSDSCNDTSVEEYTTSNENTSKNTNAGKTSMENSTGEGIVDNESSSASFDNSENNRINNEGIYFFHPLRRGISVVQLFKSLGRSYLP